jgi:hypothetical protein
MSTGDLQRLERAERLVESALQDADRIPVDLPGGRARLARLDGQRRSVRRRWVICVAASVLAVVVVTTSLVLGGPLGDKDSLPVAPSPDLTFSPSGLPVGLLVGKVDRTEPQATSTVRIIVRRDGTGIFNAGTVGDSEGDSTADLPVQFVREGPGSVRMRYHGDCFTPEALTLDFTVQGRKLVIVRADTAGCPVNRGLASDMTGTTLRILPLPQESVSR